MIIIGILDFFTGKNKEKKLREQNELKATKIVNMLNLGYPLSIINRSLYDIPEVRTAINFIATKLSQVPFHHVQYKGDMRTIKKSSFEKVLNIRPNQYNNVATFWQVVITNLLLNNNVWLYPFWNTNNGQLEELYMLPVVSSEFTTINNRLVVRLYLNQGEYLFYYEDLIHFQKFSDGTKGKINELTNYTDITESLQSQAVNESKNSGKVKALLQSKMPLKPEDVKKRVDEFNEIFQSTENLSGFGFMPGEYEVVPIDLTGNGIDSNLLSKVVNAIYNYFGVNDKIINNSASELEYEQFVDNTIKPLVHQIESELTYKLFSKGEIYNNNKIEGETVDLEISTLQAKTTFYKEMMWATVMTVNEVRQRLKLSPIEGGDEKLTNKNFFNAKGDVTSGE